MAMPGDVVVFDFPGAMGLKRRPAVIVSSDLYHLHRPDVYLVTTLPSSTRRIGGLSVRDWDAVRERMRLALG